MAYNINSFMSSKRVVKQIRRYMEMSDGATIHMDRLCSCSLLMHVPGLVCWHGYIMFSIDDLGWQVLPDEVRKCYH